MNNNLSNTEFLKRLQDVRGDEYKLIGIYEHSQRPITILHEVCGKTTEILPSNAISSRLPIPCRFCNPYSKKDTEIYTYQLNQAFPNEYEILSEYLGANKPITLKHILCGKEYTYERASGVLKGMIHCPFCHKGANITSESFLYKVDQLYGDEYTVLSDCVNSTTKVKVCHNICGFKYEVTPNEFFRGREKCPLCTKRSKLKNSDSIKRELKEKYGNKFLLLDEFNTVNNFYDFQCTSCGMISNLQLSNVLTNHIQCPYCGDGISFPEKYMRSFLDQLGVNYISQYSKSKCDWCGDYRYDFYLTEYNWIIEVHGIQHYIGGWQDLVTVQTNDKNKYELAIQNGICNYIVIDASQSESQYIKKSIEKSDLSQLGISNINWDICSKMAQKSYFKDVVDLWNNGNSVKDISSQLKIGHATVHRKLVEARENGLLNRYYGNSYKPTISEFLTQRNSKKVKCLETGEVFNSAKEADIYYSPSSKNHQNVSQCARGSSKTAYGLHWEYIS